jgi:hypothetical protein
VGISALSSISPGCARPRHHRRDHQRQGRTDLQGGDYGIVGDLFEVVPRLAEEIAKLHG